MSARVLVAKPGLDGHDRGAKVVARALRDAGYEVIYVGIRQRPVEIAHIAVQEDVDVVGLSVLSGAHVALTKRVVEALKELGAGDVPVVVGGTVPSRDLRLLEELGVARVFPTGSRSADIIAAFRELTSGERAESS
jgi:methylmalonyl-CoA mutase, C-terminal domain